MSRTKSDTALMKAEWVSIELTKEQYEQIKRLLSMRFHRVDVNDSWEHPSMPLEEERKFSLTVSGLTIKRQTTTEEKE